MAYDITWHRTSINTLVAVDDASRVVGKVFAENYGFRVQIGENADTQWFASLKGAKRNIKRIGGAEHRKIIQRIKRADYQLDLFLPNG